MKLSFLDPLFSRPGPWASVHLDTSRDIDEPDKAIDLRWRHLRDSLRDRGTDAATVSALDAAVGTGRDLPGRYGQALFAAHGRLVLVADLPDPPVRDTARFDDLPDTLPLALQRAPDIPYVAVALTRRVSDVKDGKGEKDKKGECVSVVAESGRWPVSRVAPGPRLDRVVPVEDWPRTAPRIAQEVDELAGRHGAELVVLRRDEGDAWLSGVLVNRMPIHLQNRTTVIESSPGAAADTTPGRPLMETEVARTLDGSTERTRPPPAGHLPRPARQAPPEVRGRPRRRHRPATRPRPSPPARPLPTAPGAAVGGRGTVPNRPVCRGVGGIRGEVRT